MEASLCRYHRLRSERFVVRPEAQTVKKFEEPKRDLHQGDLAEKALGLDGSHPLQAAQLKPESEKRALAASELAAGGPRHFAVGASFLWL